MPKATFIDIDPRPSATPKASPAVQSVKESVLKMSSLLDQTVDSELLPPKPEMVQLWVQRYTLTMGAPPEEEEPTEAQLAALHKKMSTLGQAPYVDFGVWLPFDRRALKAQKFRVYHPLGDGSYMMKEMPGPQNFQQWMSSWRVFKVAALMLNVVSLSNLLSSEKMVERFVVQWPNSWGLILPSGRQSGEQRDLKRLDDDFCPTTWLFRELVAGRKVLVGSSSASSGGMDGGRWTRSTYGDGGDDRWDSHSWYRRRCRSRQTA